MMKEDPKNRTRKEPFQDGRLEDPNVQRLLRMIANDARLGPVLLSIIFGGLGGGIDYDVVVGRRRPGELPGHVRILVPCDIQESDEIKLRRRVSALDDLARIFAGLESSPSRKRAFASIFTDQINARTVFDGNELERSLLTKLAEHHRDMRRSPASFAETLDARIELTVQYEREIAKILQSIFA
jgi:hypothetical protein